MTASLKRMKRQRRLAAITALVILAGALSTALWFLRADAVPDSLPALWPLLVGFLLIGFGTLINLALRWLRWHFLLRHLGVTIPARRSLTLFTLLLPMILTPFAAGEWLLGIFLKPYTPRPLITAFGVWFLARLSDVIILLLLLTHLGLLALGGLIGLALLFAALSALPLGMVRNSREYSVFGIMYVAVGILAWLPPILGLAMAAEIMGLALPLPAAAEIFTAATLYGGITGSPGGIVVTGGQMILLLMDQGIASVGAVQLTAIFRSGTTLLAVFLGLSVWLLQWKYAVQLLRGREAAIQGHFDALSSEYQHELPEHIRDRVLKRKMDYSVEALAASGVPPSARGLDIGCGHGWYAIEMARRGYAMSGCDLSAGQLAEAKKNAAAAGLALTLQEAGMDALPFPDAHFDFIYTINVMHHITDPAVRARGMKEVVRVLKPGGVFLLHEMNVRNPLFRFYMSYLFPLLKRIDDGTESWVLPFHLPVAEGAAWNRRLETYFTFIPDFVPLPVMRLLLPLERWLERSRFCKWSAHYLAVLVKQGERR